MAYYCFTNITVVLCLLKIQLQGLLICFWLQKLYHVILDANTFHFEMYIHVTIDSKLTKVDLDMGFSPSNIYYIFSRYEFVNGKDDIPYMKWKNNPNVPNHQPAFLFQHVSTDWFRGKIAENLDTINLDVFFLLTQHYDYCYHWLTMIDGWWLTYPCEKYESQLGGWFPTWWEK